MVPRPLISRAATELGRCAQAAASPPAPRMEYQVVHTAAPARAMTEHVLIVDALAMTALAACVARCADRLSRTFLWTRTEAPPST